ncbi:MAG TPA: hypothetical protein VGI24_12685 [Solirubrobacteraceae bacterium]
MSVSSEVQRTLVKSPPELWAELSDPTTLARHLGELGEIRIVRTEPDRAVDWEAAAADGAQATGRVEIKPSGWGTKVTLSAQRAVVEPRPKSETELESEADLESEPELETEAELAPEPIAEAEPEPISEPEPEPVKEPEPEPIEVIAEPEPAPEIAEPAPRPRFFARLFRRRRQPKPTVEPKPPVEVQPAPVVESEPEPVTEPEPEQVAEAEITPPAPEEAAPEPDISAELAELEEQTTAVLTGVLDRLGAAHHRPFSRS